MPSTSVDQHATLRAAILSPGGTALQPAAAGAPLSAVQILLQMHQDDATATTKGKPLRAKLAPSASTGNISAASSVGANTTHVLLDRSVPVKITAAAAAPKAAPAVASVPLSGVVRVSDSGPGPAVPIQLIATSQGVLAALPQTYKLMQQNVAAAPTLATSPARAIQPAPAAPSSAAKRRLSAPVSSGGLLKVAKLQPAATKAHLISSPSSSVVHREPTLVVANSLPHTVSDNVASRSNPSSSLASLQTAVRESYEKLFWKVYLQSSSFQSMPRPLDDGFSGSSEVSLLTFSLHVLYI